MPAARRTPLGWILDHPWLALLAVGVAVFTWWAIGTRQSEHHVRASFASAFNLVPGQVVAVDGLEVGKIGKVSYDADGKALVEIGINDERFWPLHAGTRVVSRWGTTIGSGTRRLDIVPGPASAPALPEGGIIPTADTQAAVDIDQVLNTLNRRTRGQLRDLTGSLDRGLRGHTRELNAGLHTASGGVSAAGDLMSDLATDTVALRSMIANARRLTSTLSSRAAGVEGLITVASQTFETFAANTRGTEESISELPGTLDHAQSTLARIDRSVHTLNRLMVTLAPGAKRLAPLAAQARPTLRQLRQTLPSAVRTVSEATAAAPHITNLLVEATPLMRTAPRVFSELGPMIGCVRPYAPELGGALVGGGGAHQNYDLVNPKLNPQIVRYVGAERPDGRVEQHGLRAMPMVSAATVETPLNSEEFARVSGKQYAFPRPPGLTAGQPWFIPECGITEDALDPSKDPERP